MSGGPQRVDAVTQASVEVCVGGEAAVEFKDGHAVRECPCGAGEIEVLARGLKERLGDDQRRATPNQPYSGTHQSPNAIARCATTGVAGLVGALLKT